MHPVVQDLRYAARKLRHTPAFTLIALATLSLAIGATTAVFSVVNGVLLNPLGFARPDRLVYMEAVSPTGTTMPLSPQDLSDFRVRTNSFTDVAAVDGGRSMNLVRTGVPAMRVSAARVGATFFAVLGIEPALGRTFAANEDRRDAPHVAVLSDAAWRRLFGADEHIVGERIMLDEDRYTVVGVAPAGLTFPASPDVWVPAVWRTFEIGDNARGFHSVNAIARLRDGVTLQRARADLATVAARIAAAFPQHDARVGATAAPLVDQIVGDIRRPVWASFGAVVFVLLIACANVANLLLVRAAARGAETAVRVALGAGRRRLLQQFALESLLLTSASAILGTILASWSIDAIVAFAPDAIPRAQEIAIDGRVLALTLAVAALTGLVFGILPALQLRVGDVSPVLRSGARALTRDGGRMRAGLVLVELALGTVLLAGAGLLIHSFERLTHVDPGFRSDHLIVFDVALAGRKYEYDAATNAYVDGVQSTLASIPGVVGVAVAATRPFDRDPIFDASTSFVVDGAPAPARGMEPESAVLPVSPSFFQTAGIALKRGRTFTAEDDRRDAGPVVVINEALAARYFAGQNPIGKHVTFGISHDISAAPGDTMRARGEIIGIVRDVKQTSLARASEPATYLPFHLLPASPTYLVRTASDPALVEREIRARATAVDPTMPIYELGTMDDALADSVARPRFFTLLLSIFAAVALLLAALGVYGVISHAVSLRSREFGIRIALGATAPEVIALVIRGGAWLTCAGIAIGVAGSMLATRAMSGFLFGVAPLDPLSLMGACSVLGIVATAAAWVPARRAGRADPMATMRAE
jgi:predicted permease